MPREPRTADERLLADALRTGDLSQEAMVRIRVAVEAEWRAATACPAQVDAPERAAPRTTWWPAAAAAAVAAVGVAVWVARPPAVVFGSLSRMDGTIMLSAGLARSRELHPGEALKVGDDMLARGAALVTLARGGTLRVAAGSELKVAGPNELALRRGLIYLDLPPDAPASAPLRVTTAAGDIEHLGTEFEIMSNEAAVRVRVREGRVRFLGQASTLVVDAGTELLAPAGQRVVQRPIDTYGRDWTWAAALAPDAEIEGRSLLGFLRSVSRELGRPLEFGDTNARQVAERTVLHGSVRQQAPIDAIANVLATTSLTYEIHGDTIWVRSSTNTSL